MSNFAQSKPLPLKADGCSPTPWVIAYRLEDGRFSTAEGYFVQPKGWLPLPDPQPALVIETPDDGHLLQQAWEKLNG